MTSSRDQFTRTAIAAGVAGTAITLEHLVATEIVRTISLSPEMEKRLSNFLGVATITLAFASVAQDGDSRGAQVAKLGAITVACGVAALACSAVRETARLYREGRLFNGRAAERARLARDEEDGLGPWRGFGRA